MHPIASNPPAKPSTYVFSCPEGRSLCRRLISAKLKFDPHDYQLDGVCKALDGSDLLAVTPTGSGKTGFLVMYLLVMHEIMRNPSLCPSGTIPPKHFRRDGAMVVVCPTKSLEVDMAPKFQSAGLSPLVINKDTTDKARTDRDTDIWEDVVNAHVILLSPEQLTTSGFNKLMDDPTFQNRVVAFGVDEVHLLNSWGQTFRDAFKQIGITRARFESSPVLIALTATLRSGIPLHAVCTLLGLHPGQYHFIRRSNMRYDIRFVFRTIRSSARAMVFPELDWVLEEPRRVIVFCRTIAISFRVAVYLRARWEVLRKNDLGGLNDRVRMYNALNWECYNTYTLSLLHSDSRSRITIATDALSVGIDVANTDDVVLYDFHLPNDTDSVLQKAGRIRDGREKNSRVLVYLPRNALKVSQDALD
ncbi:P-loop containing nucleoside triphosphate hydrolase protein, partial [Earliella scabrosa]